MHARPDSADDLCPAPDPAVVLPARPLASPIFPSSVYVCESAEQAERLLQGQTEGYVYQRDGHPNGDLLAEKCRLLHGAEWGAVTASGMSALSLAVLSQLRGGDHLIAADQLYGRSRQLLAQEAPRMGIGCTLVDACQPSLVAAALRKETKMIVVETISNPRLRVADIAALAKLTQAAGALLLVDNTFATPAIFRPLDHGADLVLESVTKMMNGHSDVTLGLLCGKSETKARIRPTLSTWGLAAAPFDCWLAARGLLTLAIRAERAGENALAAARHLAADGRVEQVDYPGLAEHADHETAARQFGSRFGTIVTFHLNGGRPAADAFIHAARRIPFCPSLGEISTTLSHPASTSHRSLSSEEQARQGITGGTIRLSAGIESKEHVLAALCEGLAAIELPGRAG